MQTQHDISGKKEIPVDQMSDDDLHALYEKLSAEQIAGIAHWACLEDKLSEADMRRIAEKALSSLFPSDVISVIRETIGYWDNDDRAMLRGTTESDLDEAE